MTTADGRQVTDCVPDSKRSPRGAGPLAGWGILAAIHLDLEVVRPGEGVHGLRVEGESLARGGGQHDQSPPGLGHAVMSGLENLKS